MRFSFRAQPLLDYRVHKEQQRRAEFENAKARVAQSRANVERLRGTLRKAVEPGIEWDSVALVQCEDALKRHKRVLSDAIEAVEAARSALWSAARERRILELLRERKLRSFRERQRRIEDWT